MKPALNGKPAGRRAAAISGAPRTCIVLTWSLPLLMAIVSPSSSASADPARPNVLMISVDDMNDWVNVLGSYRGTVHTPNIDRLAARGRLFTNAHCPSPMCGPSRNAILSGLNPATTGLYDNATPLYYNHPEIVPLPRHMKDNGYHVAGIGKNFHQNAGMNDPTAWDEYPNYDYRYEYAWLPPHAPLGGVDRTRHKLYVTLDWGPLEEGSRVMHDAPAVDWSIAFLRRTHDKPFFLATGIIMPHLPWYAPQRFFDLYPLDSVQLPPEKPDDLDDVPAVARRTSPDLATLQETGKLREVIQAYLACISYADDLLGRLIDTLDQSAYRDNTVVIFWSDHGYHWGEKDWLQKFTLWERSTRVPFVIAGPGVVQPGTPCGRAVSLLDVYPTVIDLCGLPGKPELEGVSLQRLLADPAAPRGEPVLTGFRPGDFTVRTDRWRYIRYGAGGEELYDHENDSHEWNNLAMDPQHAALKAELSEWIPETFAEPAPISARTHAYDALERAWKPKLSVRGDAPP
jgi:arylsulfatase A-like enzyme